MSSGIALAYFHPSHAKIAFLSPPCQREYARATPPGGPAPVTLDHHSAAQLAIAGGDSRIEPKEPAQVDIPFGGDFQPLQCDALQCAECCTSLGYPTVAASAKRSAPRAGVGGETSGG